MTSIAAKPTPEEKLFSDIVTYVDPDTFDGYDGCNCLIGQARRKAPRVKRERGVTTEVVARGYGVSREKIDEIFYGVCGDYYHNSFKRSIRLAARVLGVKP